MQKRREKIAINVLCTHCDNVIAVPNDKRSYTNTIHTNDIEPQNNRANNKYDNNEHFWTQRWNIEMQNGLCVYI